MSNNANGPLILGIESSCDETAAAIVVRGTHVLSNVIATQHELHRIYSGVVPEIASRAHLERIVPVANARYREITSAATRNELAALSGVLTRLARQARDLAD